MADWLPHKEPDAEKETGEIEHGRREMDLSLGDSQEVWNGI